MSENKNICKKCKNEQAINVDVCRICGNVMTQYAEQKINIEIKKRFNRSNKYRELENEKKNLTNELDKEKKENENLMTQLDGKNTEIDNLQHRINQFEKKIEISKKKSNYQPVLLSVFFCIIAIIFLIILFTQTY